MDRSDVVILLDVTQSQDTYGRWTETMTEREVFCRISSISANEFFNGGRNGLKPSFRVEVFFGDYQGENMLIYKGKTYSIYRTYYTNTDIVELYVEEKGGANGKHQTGSTQQGDTANP